jgi:hypothetical protein
MEGCRPTGSTDRRDWFGHAVFRPASPRANGRSRAVHDRWSYIAGGQPRLDRRKSPASRGETGGESPLLVLIIPTTIRGHGGKPLVDRPTDRRTDERTNERVKHRRTAAAAASSPARISPGHPLLRQGVAVERISSAALTGAVEVINGQHSVQCYIQASLQRQTSRAKPPAAPPCPPIASGPRAPPPTWSTNVL